MHVIMEAQAKQPEKKDRSKKSINTNFSIKRPENSPNKRHKSKSRGTAKKRNNSAVSTMQEHVPKNKMRASSSQIIRTSTMSIKKQSAAKFDTQFKQKKPSN